MEVVDPEVAVRWPVCRHVQIPVCSRLQLSPICPPGRRCLDNPSVLRMWLCMRIMLAGRGGVRDHRGEQARPKAFHMRSWQKPVALLLGLCFCAPTVYGFRLNLPSRPVVTRRAGPSPSTRERRQVGSHHTMLMACISLQTCTMDTLDASARPKALFGAIVRRHRPRG